MMSKLGQRIRRAIEGELQPYRDDLEIPVGLMEVFGRKPPEEEIVIKINPNNYERFSDETKKRLLMWFGIRVVEDENAPRYGVEDDLVKRHYDTQLVHIRKGWQARCLARLDPKTKIILGKGYNVKFEFDLDNWYMREMHLEESYEPGAETYLVNPREVRKSPWSRW